LLVDGDLDQALAAGPGFHGPTPGVGQVALIGVIHGVEGTLRAGAVHAKMVCKNGLPLPLSFGNPEFP